MNILEILKNIYDYINKLLANNLIVVVIVIPVVSFLVRRKIEKSDVKFKQKKEDIYVPLYNMFASIEAKYVFNDKLESDFENIDLDIWHDICNCEKNLLIEKKLDKLMNNFVDNTLDFLEKWEDYVKEVIDQYNDMAKKFDGLDQLCTEERKSRIMDYDKEVLQMKRFSFALLRREYENAFDLIIPEKDWHINFIENYENGKKDLRDLVLEDKDNIIESIKKIEIDNDVEQAYKNFKIEESKINTYLSNKIK